MELGFSTLVAAFVPLFNYLVVLHVKSSTEFLQLLVVQSVHLFFWFLLYCLQ